MHFGKSAGNFGGSAVRRPVVHDSAAAMSELVALLPNYMQIVQNWSEKGVFVESHHFNFHIRLPAKATFTNSNTFTSASPTSSKPPHRT